MAGMLGSPLRILLVEDEPADAALVVEAFAEAGRTVALTVVTSGYAALDYLRHQSPYEAVGPIHLVLLDLNLPGLSGPAVLRAIHSDPLLKDVRVVILTTAGLTMIPAECRNQADDYIHKALVWPDFVARLEQVMQRLTTTTGPGTRSARH